MKWTKAWNRKGSTEAALNKPVLIPNNTEPEDNPSVTDNTSPEIHLIPENDDDNDDAVRPTPTVGVVTNYYAALDDDEDNNDVPLVQEDSEDAEETNIQAGRDNDEPALTTRL